MSVFFERQQFSVGFIFRVQCGLGSGKSPHTPGGLVFYPNTMAPGPKKKTAHGSIHEKEGKMQVEETIPMEFLHFGQNCIFWGGNWRTTTQSVQKIGFDCKETPPKFL